MNAFFHKEAKKYYSRLGKIDRDRFDEAFADLEKEPPRGDIRPYEGSKDVLRLKVGNYRVLFKYVDKKILVTHIEPRGQVYKKKTKSKRGK